MNRLKRIFGVRKSPNEQNSSLSTINTLREMEEMLSKKQIFLEEQAQAQLSLARKHGLKNKRAALLALKRKKRFETLLQQVDGTLSTLEMQREALEQAKNNISVLQAMKSAAQTLKSAQLHMDVDQVHDVMDDIAEQQEVAQQISQAISSPIPAVFGGTEVDEAELEKELEALEQEDLDRELLHIEPFSVFQPHEDGPPGRQSSEEGQASKKDGGAQSQSRKAPEPKTEEDKELDELSQWAATM